MALVAPEQDTVPHNPHLTPPEGLFIHLPDGFLHDRRVSEWEGFNGNSYLGEHISHRIHFYIWDSWSTFAPSCSIFFDGGGLEGIYE